MSDTPGLLDSIYRVQINRTGVVVMALGNMGTLTNGHYDCVEDLPEWVQERLAVLYMCPCEHPTPYIEGVGRRISVNVFWVVE